MRKLNCGKSAVQPTVKLARRTLRKRATEPHIIDSLITSLFCTKTESGRNYSQRNIDQLLKQIDCANWILYRHFPDEIQLLTFVIPSLSETTYLAACALSDEIPQQIIKRLVSSEQDALYIYRWEPQSKRSGDEGRLHLHIFLKASTQYSVATLRRIWFEVLDDFLDERTLCDPFIGENGENLRSTGDWINGEPFSELPDQEKYPATYLALHKKEGRSTFPQRKLDICGGKRIFPVRHGGVSPALQLLVDAEMLGVRIPARSLMERQHLETEFRKRLHALSFEIKQTSEFYGNCKLRIPKSIYTDVRDLIKTFESENSSGIEVERAEHYILLKLSPNLELGIYPHSRKEIN